MIQLANNVLHIVNNSNHEYNNLKNFDYDKSKLLMYAGLPSTQYQSKSCFLSPFFSNRLKQINIVNTDIPWRLGGLTFIQKTNKSFIDLLEFHNLLIDQIYKTDLKYYFEKYSQTYALLHNDAFTPKEFIYNINQLQLYNNKIALSVLPIDFINEINNYSTFQKYTLPLIGNFILKHKEYHVLS